MSSPIRITKVRAIACALVFFFWPGLAGAEEENAFTHGPILGRLSEQGVGIWARTAREGVFAVRFGTSPSELHFESGMVKTRFVRDNTGWVHLDGLKPNTTYHYELVFPGDRTGSRRGGSFRTLPRTRDQIDPELNPRGLFNFSFEFACGNNQNAGLGLGPSLPAFSTMIERHAGHIDFAIFNGDWLYEAKRDYLRNDWAKQVGCTPAELPDLVKVAPTIVGVWENYKQFLNQAENLTRWHSVVPTFFTFDDHEILNDVWGAGSPGLRDRRAVFRDIGVRAWYDYLGWSNPTAFTQRSHFGRGRMEKGSDVLVDPSVDFTRIDLSQTNNLHVHWGTTTAGVNDNALDDVGGDPNAGVYEIVRVIDGQRIQVRPAADATGEVSYSIGRRSYYEMRVSNCHFFVLDTRSQRQMHDTSDPHKKGLSILGPTQRKWLIEGMKKSDTDFFFVVSSVNFMIPHVGGTKIRTSNKDDAWTVFLDERKKLIDFWDTLDDPVFVLSGDLHNSFVIQITDNVWEFASGPHNSQNHWYTDEGNRPANGRFSYGGRDFDIRWSTFFRTDIPREELGHPSYCVVQINNVFNNPKKLGGTRWVAFPRPQVIFQYFDGRTGELRYAESVLARNQ